MSDSHAIQIFRCSNALAPSEPDDNHGMVAAPMTAQQEAATMRMFEAGMADGFVLKSLFSAPGYSLTYVWFKPNFPLSRHAHNGDCAYYIISGTVRMGQEELAAGDGFFVPKDTPYTYKIGAEGVEVLEIRHSAFFDYKNLANSDAFIDKAVKTITENRTAWLEATPPRPAL